MGLANPNDPTALRTALNARAAALRGEIAAAQRARQASEAHGTHEVADRKDEATQQQFDEVDDAQEQRDRDELAQVEAALQRLDAGVYGGCVDCGEPIPLPRLRVQPAAPRCAGCQQAREKARVRSS